LLVEPLSGLGASDAAVVTRVEQDDTARAVTGLARRFSALLRAAGKGRTVAGDQNADAAADIAAVRAALTEPWSRGSAEGQVDRLKPIKRKRCGWAGLELLELRMILAA
jgi:transposase